MKTSTVMIASMAASVHALLCVDIKLPLGISANVDILCPESEELRDGCIDTWHPPHSVIIDECDNTHTDEWHWVHPTPDPTGPQYTWVTTTITAVQTTTTAGQCEPGVVSCDGSGTVITTLSEYTSIRPVPVTSTASLPSTTGPQTAGPSDHTDVGTYPPGPNPTGLAGTGPNPSGPAGPNPSSPATTGPPAHIKSAGPNSSDNTAAGPLQTLTSPTTTNTVLQPVPPNIVTGVSTLSMVVKTGNSVPTGEVAHPSNTSISAVTPTGLAPGSGSGDRGRAGFVSVAGQGGNGTAFQPPSMSGAAKNSCSFVVALAIIAYFI